MRYFEAAIAFQVALGSSVVALTSCGEPLAQNHAAFMTQPTPLVSDTTIEISHARLLRPAAAHHVADRLLVVFPGMYKDASEYESLAKKIQLATPQRLWIAILNFTGNLTNPVQAEALVDSVLSDVKQQGFLNVSDQKTTLAGHSFGGIVAQGIIKKRSFHGLVLFSSYLTKVNGSSSLPQFDKPVLTISGELDGQTRLTRIAVDAKAVLDSEALQNSSWKSVQLSKKPVIVLSGVNHSHFANGKRMKADLEAEVPYEDSQTAIAKVVADFLILNENEATIQRKQKEAAKNRISAYVRESRDLLTPFWSANTFEKDWCLQSQRSEVPMENPAKKEIRATQEFFSDTVLFLRSKPTLNVNSDGDIEINATAMFKHAMNPIDISTVPEATQEIACKMKSREAIAVAASIAKNIDDEVSCSESNKRAFEWALNNVSEKVRERFARRGRQLKFDDDRVFGSGIQWVTSGLEFKNSQTERISIVSSSSLRTGTSAPLGLGGMHYCKLMSPARAMEWILVDGLRDH